MNYRVILLEQLKALPYFSKKDIYQLSEQYGLKKATVDSYIGRSVRQKALIPFKNGLYVSADFYSENKSDSSYLFYLANVLRTPSYVSSWAALEHYGLVSEAIHVVTSVTPKITKSYKTKAGNFSYQSIQKELFSDFTSVKGKFNFFIATPSKALFDLLYFRTRQFRGIQFEQIPALIEELRIDFDEMNKKEQKTFFTMIKNYING